MSESAEVEIVASSEASQPCDPRARLEEHGEQCHARNIIIASWRSLPFLSMRGVVICSADNGAEALGISVVVILDLTGVKIGSPS